jgi:hypothetical protein
MDEDYRLYRRRKRQNIALMAALTVMIHQCPHGSELRLAYIKLLEGLVQSMLQEQLLRTERTLRRRIDQVKDQLDEYWTELLEAEGPTTVYERRVAEKSRELKMWERALAKTIAQQRWQVAWAAGSL